MMNKKSTKIFLTAVIISLVMAYLPVQTAAKDKICLNETKITLNAGQTKKLTLIKNKKNVTKKIKWSSKNKNKVSVNKKGVVRALRSGQTKITAKYQGKKYVCTVIVKSKALTEKATPKPSQTPKQTTFRNSALLAEHYEKHGKEMGFPDAQSYEQAAAAVVANPLSLHKLEAEDNDDVYYLESTNEFVIVSTDGYIRTYFKPDKGRAYFDQQ